MAAGVRDAATANGLVMMMHANSFEAQQFAVNADVDVIAHGMWNWGALDRQPELPPEIKALLDRIVQKRTGYQATIQVTRGLRTTYRGLVHL
jgi:FMN-dependent NADH-azoreductase